MLWKTPKFVFILTNAVFGLVSLFFSHGSPEQTQALLQLFQIWPSAMEIMRILLKNLLIERKLLLSPVKFNIVSSGEEKNSILCFSKDLMISLSISITVKPSLKR